MSTPIDNKLDSRLETREGRRFRDCRSSSRLLEELGSLSLFQCLLLLCFNVLIFAGPIQDATGFSMIDELAALLLFASGTIRSSRRALSPHFKITAVLLALIALLGVLGNLFFHVQQSTAAVILDALACTKFFFALFGCYMLSHDFKSLLVFFRFEAIVLIWFLAFCALVNLFVPFGMDSQGGRYWSVSFKGFWSHPTVVVWVGVALASIISTMGTKGLPHLLACCFAVLCTQRSKGFVAIATLMFLFVMVGRKTHKLNLLSLLVLALLGIAVGWDAFVLYFSMEGAARPELFQAGIAIANDYFPIGAGFASFGTNMSGVSYSPLYFTYGLNEVYGLTPQDYGFISDSFWPAVLGQFGWIALFLFLFMLYFIWKSINETVNSKYQFIAAIFPFVYLLISSTSESAFFNPSSIFLAMVIGLSMSNINEKPGQRT